MIEWLEDFDLLDGTSTRKLIYDRIASRKVQLEEEINVTSSHVIRINLSTDITTELIKSIKYK
jgi:hypothetical protein